MRIPWSEKAAFRRWLFLAFWLLMFVATHVPHVERFGPRSLLGIPHFDKVVHFSMFAGWMVLVWWVVSSRSKKPSSGMLLSLFVAGALYGIFDELSQSLVGRDTSTGDLLADLAGMATAAVILRWRARTSARRRT